MKVKRLKAKTNLNCANDCCKIIKKSKKTFLHAKNSDQTTPKSVSFFHHRPVCIHMHEGQSLSSEGKRSDVKAAKNILRQYKPFALECLLS